jgi:hypothetical protein
MIPAAQADIRFPYVLMSAAFCSTPISCALHQTKSHGRFAMHFPLARALPGKVKIGPNIVNTQIHFTTGCGSIRRQRRAEK